MRRLPLLLVAVITAMVLGLVAACGNTGGEAVAPPTTGVAIYKAYCATCHGARGQGFVGPALAGVVATKYPNIDDQIALVTNGKGEMPAWGGRLSAGQIRRVVVYERTKLGT